MRIAGKRRYSRKGGDMGEPKPKRAQRSAGAFLGTDGIGMVPVPMRTLSDDYHDEPTEPEEDHVPEAEPPTLVHRVLDRLTRRARPTP